MNADGSLGFSGLQGHDGESEGRGEEQRARSASNEVLGHVPRTNYVN